jgi:hypothetical protein
MVRRNFQTVLKVLAEADADFILVGGLAAVIHGAPVSTFDVDIVHSRSPENILRLVPALMSLNAIFKIQPERNLKPTERHLSGPRRLNLVCQYGPVDLLGTIGKDLSYEELLPHMTWMNAGEGIQIRVLSLEKLIEIKEELRGEKDLAVLPILRQTLKESRQRGS